MAVINKTIYVCDKCKCESETKFPRKHPASLKADVDLQICQGDKIHWEMLCGKCNEKVKDIISQIITNHLKEQNHD